jgi:biotin transport system ATP-binding protein
MLPVASKPSLAAASLHIRDVTLQRGANTIFSGLTLDLTEPRIGLIGDNGAGKSSLFRMLCGLDVPQSGSVTVRGLEARTVSSQRPGLVGMMFQNPDEQIIFPTVAEELALGLSPSGLSRREAIAQARVFLETRSLAHWADRAIGALSHGQRQQVCWLALMIASPELLLLDEPFASLDQPGQALLSMDIAKASQQIMVSTHLLEHVLPFERVIWLERGQVRADGPGAQVCAAYQSNVAARIAAQALSYQ